jgi:hypothetical protein
LFFCNLDRYEERQTVALGLRARLALRRILGVLSLHDLANLELPAAEEAGFSLHLACDLYLEGVSGAWISPAVMRGNDRMRSQVRLRVMALRQTEDLMEQDLVPATQTVQHLE